MKILLDNKFYVRPGVKIFREADNLIHFSSPYTCDRYWLKNNKEILDIIENLEKDKSLYDILNKLNLSSSYIKDNNLSDSICFLCEKEVIGQKPFETSLSELEIEFYYNNIFHLNFLFKKNGLDLQEKLKKKCICIIGVGGTGTSLLVSLIGMGIGHIKLIDHDVISADNLPRQMFYKYSDIGKSKVDKMKKYINNLNPFINVENFNICLNNKNKSKIKNIFKDCDLIIVAADEPDYIVILNQVQEFCFEMNLPFIGGAAGDGFIPPLVIPYKSACIKCMLKALPQDQYKKYIHDNDSKLKLDRFMWPYMSVPYYKLLEGNTFVAREVLKFLLFQKSDLINNFYTSMSSNLKFIPKLKNCICNKKS